METEEDIFKAISDFMKGKSGASGADIAKLVVDGELPAEALIRPTLSSTFSEFAEEYTGVVNGLSNCSLSDCLKVLGSMLTLPEFQCNDYRLRVLIHLCFIFAKGKKKPTPAQITAWFNQLDAGTCGRMEDPAEDVFISRVFYGSCAYRLFEGSAEGNGFHTQLFLIIIEHMPDEGVFAYIKHSIEPLLMLSELIAERANLPAHLVGKTSPAGRIKKPRHDTWTELRQRVSFAKEELIAIGIDPSALKPFFSSDEELQNLGLFGPGCSPLDLRVLFEKNDRIIVHMPNMIGTAIRALVIHTLIHQGHSLQLQSALAEAYRSLFMSEGFIDVTPPPFEFQQTNSYQISQVSKEIDDGRYLHILFFIDGFDNFEKGGFVGINNVDELTAIVAPCIKQAHEFASRNDNFKGGLSLIVGCGWGRALGISSIDCPEGWRMEMLPAHDAVTLTRLPRFNMMDVWRALDARDAIEAEGVHLSNANGFLNLVAWIRSNNGHIVPHEKLDNEVVDDRPGILTLPINCNLDARLEAVQATDTQNIIDPKGRITEVRRTHSTPKYGSSELVPFYVDTKAIRDQIYRSVFIGDKCNYWIEATTVPSVSLEFRYNLCNMIMHWAEKVFSHFDRKSDLQGIEYLSLKYHFKDLEEPNGNDPIPDEQAIEATIALSEVANEYSIKYEIGERFISGVRRTDNLAERLIVRSMVQAVCQIANLNLKQEQIHDCVNEIVRNDNARHVHGFSVPRSRDFVRDNLAAAITIERTDDANSRIGLGWMCREKSEGNHVEGIPDCKRYIKSLVQSIIDDLKVSVSQFNRDELLIKLIRNHEAVFVDLDTWKRTYGAIEALSDSDELAALHAAEKVAGLNAASMSCRIVSEIAICECASGGGLTPGNYDIQKLMTQASLLHHMGGYSDAIEAELMPAEILISQGGDVMMNHDFTDDVIRPFGESFQTSSLRGAAEKYVENYFAATTNEEDRKSKNSIDADERKFAEAWLEEFGFSLDDLRNILTQLDDMLVSRRKAVEMLSISEVMSMLSNGGEISETAANKFLECFSLRPRKKWDETPEGMMSSSWQPWRFQRQLSLVSRPIMILDGTGEDKCLIAPAMIIEHLIKFAADARTGALDQNFFRKNGAMFTWIGTINGQEGEAFNEIVANKFRECGWEAASNQSDGQLLNRKKDPSFGDVDVFAWHKDEERVLAIECKDLSFDKTMGEIARRLKNFRGLPKANGKPDDLLKHIDRCDVLDNNTDRLEAVTGFKTPTVERVLLFSQQTPMQFSDITKKYGVEMCKFDDVEQKFGGKLTQTPIS